MVAAPASTVRRILVAGVAGLVAGLATLVGPAPAFAHAELLSSDPIAGAVLEQAPTTVTLTFSEPVDILADAIRLFDGDGARLSLDPATSSEGGKLVTVELPELPLGSYVVSWQAVSTDSHPATGAFTFQIGTASTLAPDVLDQVQSEQATNQTAEFLVGLTRVLVIVGMVLVGGILAAIALGAVTPNRPRRLAVIGGALVGGIGGLLAIPLQTVYVQGLGLGDLTAGSAWRATLDTRLGTAWLLRALIVSVGGVALVLTSSRPRRRWWRASVAGLLLALGTTSAYGGHGATGRWVFLGIDATVVHVTAMSVWIGGLVALFLGSGDLTLDGVRRFSNTAVIAVIAVAFSGTVQAVRRLESVSSLLDTDYGRLLLTKVVAVAAILGFAAASRTAIHGRVMPGRRPLPVGAAPALDRAGLRRSVIAELVFAAAIVVLTASIMGANPSAAGSTEPFSTSAYSGQYLATITVDPAGAGPNQVHLYLSSPGGSLSRPDSLTVSISDPATGIAPIGLAVVAVGANHYQAIDATFPYAGAWQLTIRAVYNRFDEIVFSTEVEIR